MTGSRRVAVASVVVAAAGVPLGDLASSEVSSDSCTRNGAQAYDNGTYTGYYEVLSACAGTTTLLGLAALQPADRSYGVVVVIQVVSERDVDATAEIPRSFEVRY